MKRTLAEDAALVEAGSLDAMATTKSKRPQTQNAGAALERQAIMRKIRVMVALVADKEPLIELESWIMDRTKRNNATPGGLGKKK